MPSVEKNDEKPRKRESDAYVQSLLRLYVRLPHTPNKHRPDDRFLAERLRRRRVPRHQVEAALLLGTARRFFRTDPAEPLQPIRSLRYFLPVLDELRHARVDPAYLDYLRHKLSEVLSPETSTDSSQAGTPAGPATAPPRTQLTFDW